MRQLGRCLCENWLVFLIIGWLVLISAVPITSWRWLSGRIVNAEPEHLQRWGWYLLGAGIAPLTLLLTHNRTQSLRMQTDTDIFTKSIKLLGDEQAAVRQGGIYSLGKIAKDDPKLYTTIMKIMTSYVRAKTYTRFHELLKETGLTEEELINKLADEKEPMSSDIEAAIEVIRKRQINNDKLLINNENRFEFPLKFDLSNSYILNADLGETDLSKTDFSDSKILGCRFDRTNLSNSYFSTSNLQKSSFVKSILEGCQFKDTDFRRCDFEGCEFSRSKFEKCDLSGAENLTREQINSAESFDEATRLTLPRIKVPPNKSSNG